MQNQYLIDIENLCVSFNENQIFNNFNFQIKKGERIGITGPTGSGKSTLLNEIVKTYLYNVSYVFQESRLIENITVEKNLELCLNKNNKNNKNSQKIHQILQETDLLHKSNILAKNLSVGEKQRLNISRAFIIDRPILLMDEPFSSQDEIHKKMMITLTNKIVENKTLIIVSHSKEELKQLNCKIIEL